MRNKRIKLAILDLYDSTPNQGMRAIEKILQWYEDEVEWKVFDVRAKTEIPDLDYDIFISSGGPGDPLDFDGVWSKLYFDLIDRVWSFNKNASGAKKHVLFICHSFQMACHHFGLAKVSHRWERSFGIFPCFKTNLGKEETLLEDLANPFWVADFRDYQVVQPNWERIHEMGAKILAIENPHRDPEMERAIMAVRFSDEFFGTQFHPEADPEGMLVHFRMEERKAGVIKEYGQEKYDDIIEHLSDPEKIQMTHQSI
ncbi:MAG TPA: GMP synthase, partial [Phaeodactylibacter sp.]|nr:GMP synthase [Phaeodactylibacter sp.]